ncbi:uncharacterized protein BO72DRAFT_27240 [Aspergillus fijiensis CBS 313.89]|uniref:Uncharacterized protein n=1 Tax=Aspergillus fijiensis CBS 313.89 TaxID=1448319 RepID=A0A8G1RXG0_9EURO|nr:uncharacterized protein BO72DRAFT_27240 [Aspergillus fijiensis CBS 313.89]RAK80078.1 hypothetical protein BO72DRAFT_27240 [Aspergillus fijiensis CBS 313.89]
MEFGDCGVARRRARSWNADPFTLFIYVYKELMGEEVTMQSYALLYFGGSLGPALICKYTVNALCCYKYHKNTGTSSRWGMQKLWTVSKIKRSVLSYLPFNNKRILGRRL